MLHCQKFLALKTKIRLRAVLKDTARLRGQCAWIEKNEVSSLASVILYLSMDPQLITILDMRVMTQLISFFPLDCKLHEDKKHLFSRQCLA